jgi:hypothetical protein
MRKQGSPIRKRVVDLTLFGVIVIVGGMIVPGCGFEDYDSFYDTEPSFELDRDVYFVGDTIQLTFVLHGESEVRLYKNIENTLSVWLAFRVPYEEEHTVVSYDGIYSEEIEPRDRGSINTYNLEKGKPLLLNFHGYIHESEETDVFNIVFPSLNKRFVVQKEAYANALSLEIHALLTPIKPGPGDSLEDYVRPVKLQIHT